MIKKESVKRSAVKSAKTASKSVKKAADVKAVAKKSKAIEAKKNVEEDEVNLIADAILDKKGQNVISLDLRELGSSICDFFVICNADSTTNVSAIADNIEDQMILKLKKKVLRSQGRENSFWIIMDYGSIVVHIFQTQYRDFYRLEELWGDCKIKKYQD